jgi:hypothetical protein
MLKIITFHRFFLFLTRYIENLFHISSPQINQTKLIDFPKSTTNLRLMNFTTNLPEEPTFNESKFKETLRENLRFIKSLMYLTKKLFML